MDICIILYLKFEKLLFLSVLLLSELKVLLMVVGGEGRGKRRHNRGGSLVQKRPMHLAKPIKAGTVD